jgi:hypothetical protein
MVFINGDDIFRNLPKLVLVKYQRAYSYQLLCSETFLFSFKDGEVHIFLNFDEV